MLVLVCVFYILAYLPYGSTALSPPIYCEVPGANAVYPSASSAAPFYYATNAYVLLLSDCSLVPLPSTSGTKIGVGYTPTLDVALITTRDGKVILFNPLTGSLYDTLSTGAYGSVSNVTSDWYVWAGPDSSSTRTRYSLATKQFVSTGAVCSVPICQSYLQPEFVTDDGMYATYFCVSPTSGVAYRFAGSIENGVCDYLAPTIVQFTPNGNDTFSFFIGKMTSGATVAAFRDATGAKLLRFFQISPTVQDLGTMQVPGMIPSPAVICQGVPTFAVANSTGFYVYEVLISVLGTVTLLDVSVPEEQEAYLRAAPFPGVPYLALGLCSDTRYVVFQNASYMTTLKLRVSPQAPPVAIVPAADWLAPIAQSSITVEQGVRFADSWIKFDCPVNALMKKARAKFLGSQGTFGDDQGITGLQFTCDDGTVKKYEGPHGSWQSEVSCEPFQWICGAEAQYDMATADPEGMTGLKITCCDVRGEHNGNTKLVVNGVASTVKWRGPSPNGHLCTPGAYMNGFAVKYYYTSAIFSHASLGIDALQLDCIRPESFAPLADSPLSMPPQDNLTFLVSPQAPEEMLVENGVDGSWFGWLPGCKGDAVVKGVSAYREPQGTLKDDMGMLGYQILCSDGQKYTFKSQTLSGASWTSMTTCDTAQQVCGVQVQYESGAGIDGLRIYCCDQAGVSKRDKLVYGGTGSWKNTFKCAKGEYVMNFNPRYEKKASTFLGIPTSNSQGLNGLKMMCARPALVDQYFSGDVFANPLAAIVPAATGDWHTVEQGDGSGGIMAERPCPNDGYSVFRSMQLWRGQIQWKCTFWGTKCNSPGGKLGVYQAQIKCANFDTAAYTRTFTDKAGGGVGSGYTRAGSTRACPGGQGICGMRARYDDGHWTNDDEGITAVGIKCCDYIGTVKGTYNVYTDKTNPDGDWQPHWEMCPTGQFVTSMRWAHASKIGIYYLAMRCGRPGKIKLPDIPPPPVNPPPVWPANCPTCEEICDSPLAPLLAIPPPSPPPVPPSACTPGQQYNLTSYSDDYTEDADYCEWECRQDKQCRAYTFIPDKCADLGKKLVGGTCSMYRVAASTYSNPCACSGVISLSAAETSCDKVNPACGLQWGDLADLQRPPSSAKWEPSSDGRTVWQRVNTGGPAFGLTAGKFSSFIMSYDVVVDTPYDNDYIGFTMGHKLPTEESPMAWDQFLVSWKKNNDYGAGGNMESSWRAGYDYTKRDDGWEGVGLSRIKAACMCNSKYIGVWASSRSPATYNRTKACEDWATVDCGVCSDTGARDPFTNGAGPAFCSATGNSRDRSKNPISAGLSTTTVGYKPAWSGLLAFFWNQGWCRQKLSSSDTTSYPPKNCKTFSWDNNGVLFKNMQYFYKGRGKSGWDHRKEYHIRLYYSPTNVRFRIYGPTGDTKYGVEGITAIDYKFGSDAGITHQPGYAGFYLLSQSDVKVWNFRFISLDPKPTHKCADLTGTTPISMMEVYDVEDSSKPLHVNATSSLGGLLENDFDPHLLQIYIVSGGTVVRGASSPATFKTYYDGSIKVWQNGDFEYTAPAKNYKGERDFLEYAVQNSDGATSNTTRAYFEFDAGRYVARIAWYPVADPQMLPKTDDELGELRAFDQYGVEMCEVVFYMKDHNEQRFTTLGVNVVVDDDTKWDTGGIPTSTGTEYWGTILATDSVTNTSLTTTELLVTIIDPEKCKTSNWTDVSLCKLMPVELTTPATLVPCDDNNKTSNFSGSIQIQGFERWLLLEAVGTKDCQSSNYDPNGGPAAKPEYLRPQVGEPTANTTWTSTNDVPFQTTGCHWHYLSTAVYVAIYQTVEFAYGVQGAASIWLDGHDLSNTTSAATVQNVPVDGIHLNPGWHQIIVQLKCFGDCFFDLGVTKCYSLENNPSIPEAWQIQQTRTITKGDPDCATTSQYVSCEPPPDSAYMPMPQAPVPLREIPVYVPTPVQFPVLEEVPVQVWVNKSIPGYVPVAVPVEVPDPIIPVAVPVAIPVEWLVPIEELVPVRKNTPVGKATPVLKEIPVGIDTPVGQPVGVPVGIPVYVPVTNEVPADLPVAVPFAKRVPVSNEVPVYEPVSVPVQIPVANYVPVSNFVPRGVPVAVPVEVPVPVPYDITQPFEKFIPVEVPVSVPAFIDFPVANYIPYGVPNRVDVQVPVEKLVPVANSIPMNYPVSKDVPVAYKTPVAVNVSVPVAIPVGVPYDNAVPNLIQTPVANPVAVPVWAEVPIEKPVPMYQPVGKETPVDNLIPVDVPVAFGVNVPVLQNIPVANNIPISNEVPVYAPYGRAVPKLNIIDTPVAFYVPVAKVTNEVQFPLAVPIGVPVATPKLVEFPVGREVINDVPEKNNVPIAIPVANVTDIPMTQWVPMYKEVPREVPVSISSPRVNLVPQDVPVAWPVGVPVDVPVNVNIKNVDVPVAVLTPFGIPVGVPQALNVTVPVDIVTKVFSPKGVPRAVPSFNFVERNVPVATPVTVLQPDYIRTPIESPVLNEVPEARPFPLIKLTPVPYPPHAYGAPHFIPVAVPVDIPQAQEFPIAFEVPRFKEITYQQPVINLVPIAVPFENRVPLSVTQANQIPMDFPVAVPTNVPVAVNFPVGIPVLNEVPVPQVNIEPRSVPVRFEVEKPVPVGVPVGVPVDWKVPKALEVANSVPIYNFVPLETPVTYNIPMEKVNTIAVPIEKRVPVAGPPFYFEVPIAVPKLVTTGQPVYFPLGVPVGVPVAQSTPTDSSTPRFVPIGKPVPTAVYNDVPQAVPVGIPLEVNQPRYVDVPYSQDVPEARPIAAPVSTTEPYYKDIPAVSEVPVGVPMWNDYNVSVPVVRWVPVAAETPVDVPVAVPRSKNVPVYGKAFGVPRGIDMNISARSPLFRDSSQFPKFFPEGGSLFPPPPPIVPVQGNNAPGNDETPVYVAAGGAAGSLFIWLACAAAAALISLVMLALIVFKRRSFTVEQDQNVLDWRRTAQTEDTRYDQLDDEPDD